METAIKTSARNIRTPVATPCHPQWKPGSPNRLRSSQATLRGLFSSAHGWAVNDQIRLQCVLLHQTQELTSCSGPEGDVEKQWKTWCRAFEGALAVVTFQTFYRGDHKTLKNETLASGAISSSSSSSACVQVHENVQQRSMTYVCKCMRTYSSVAWRMCASAWERTAA